MSVEVFAADEQSAESVDTLRWVRLARDVLDAEGIGGDVEMSMLFVDEPAMTELNRRFLGREGPTDVLSFPIDEDLIDAGRSPDAGGPGPGALPTSSTNPRPMSEAMAASELTPRTPSTPARVMGCL